MNWDSIEFQISFNGGDLCLVDWGLCCIVYEKDFCGFGFIVSFDDQVSYWVL